MVSEHNIIDGLIELGLEGKAVEVHSSLSSFSYVVGGAQSVVRALLTVCDAVLVPTYSSIGRTKIFVSRVILYTRILSCIPRLSYGIFYILLNLFVASIMTSKSG